MIVIFSLFKVYFFVLILVGKLVIWCLAFVLHYCCLYFSFFFCLEFVLILLCFDFFSVSLFV